MSRSLAAIVLAAAALFTAENGASAASRVPATWLGVVADGPLIAPGNRYDGEWDAMAAAGARIVRVPRYWRDVEPFAGAFDPARFDALVLAGARRGLVVVPVVQGTPAWASVRPDDVASPPRDRAAFGAFLARLVARYGPAGSLWAEHPEVARRPVRAWQIWNEPNLTRYWSTQPFAPGYVRLLRVARRSLRAADPGARAILAGLPNESWLALRSIYRAGGRGHFDAIALHPYTGKPRNVVKLVELARREARRYRDARRPVWVTELSWPSSNGVTKNTPGFETTESGQARRLASALDLLARARRRLRIEHVVWHTWLSEEPSENSFAYSGLRRVRGGQVVSVPALAAFRRAAARLRR